MGAERSRGARWKALPARRRCVPSHISRCGAGLGCLKEHGYLLLVITNQPDVSRGRQKRDAVDTMNRRLRTEFPLDDILTCYHDDPDDCDC